MPVQKPIGRQQTYRAFGADGELLASEELASDQEAVAWARRLARDGLIIQRVNREITAGVGMDIPLD